MIPRVQQLPQPTNRSTISRFVRSSKTTRPLYGGASTGPWLQLAGMSLFNCRVFYLVYLWSRQPQANCYVSRGFDAQINGAMISVASFRRDFGLVPPPISSTAMETKHTTLFLQIEVADLLTLQICPRRRSDPASRLAISLQHYQHRWPVLWRFRLQLARRQDRP